VNFLDGAAIPKTEEKARGPPLPLRAEGKDKIIEMLQGLYQIQRYFMQMTHSG
jgi:hypothetical protein